MKKTAILFIFLLAEYVLGGVLYDGQTVYINDSKAYISAFPHTFYKPGYVYFTLNSKEYSGLIDVGLAFNVSDGAKISDLELMVYNTSVSKNLSCESLPGRGYVINTSKKQVLCYQNYTDLLDGNISKNYTVWDHSYQVINQSTRTIFYNEIMPVSYISLAKKFTELPGGFHSWNRFYYASGLNVVEGKEYNVRIYLDLPFGSFGEYAIAIKPSQYTLNEALSNGYLYILDPWWNTSYSKRLSFYLNSSQNIEDLTDFPARLAFDTTGLIASGSLDSNCFGVEFTYVNSSGDEVYIPRYRDNGTCNTPNTRFTVKIPTFRTSAFNETIYAYIRNASSDNQLPYSVFSNNYSEVIHCDNSYKGLLGSNSSLTGSLTYTVLGAFAPVLGQQCFFNGSNNVAYYNNLTLPATAFSVSFFNMDDSGTGSFKRIVQVDTATNFLFRTSNDVPSRLAGYYNSNGFDINPYSWKGSVSYYSLIKTPGNRGLVYLNDSLIPLANVSAGDVGPGFYMGSASGTEFLSGYMDELHIRTVSSSNGWRIAEYMMSYSNVSTDSFVQNVSFISQVPADITSISMFNDRANITYYINSSMDFVNSSILIFYKTNNSFTDYLRFINGSEYGGFRNTSYDYVSGKNFSFSLGDAKVYPYTENLDFQTYFRNSEHIRTDLTGANNYLSIELLNISINNTYNYFEITLNSSINMTVPVYYCNRSYGFNSAPVSNSNCIQFATINNSNSYNHCHNLSLAAGSCHHVLPFGINSSNGMIGNVLITSNGTFIVRGQVIGTIYVWGVQNLSRTNAIRKSLNNGNSWTGQTFTIDSHLHQFTGNDSLYYFVCANETAGPGTCSTIRNDLLDLGNLPPNAPGVYSPINQTYNESIIDVNYTSSISPNNYPIIWYNISLFNASYVFLDFLYNNSLNLSWGYNTSSLSSGFYKIGVTACDNNSLCDTGFSDTFYFNSSISTTTTTTTTTPGSTTTSTTIYSPPAGTNGINEIYAIMFPVFAFLAMLSIFIYTEEDIVRILKPLISAVLWFISGYFTVSIRYVGDFTTIMSPYYVDRGNDIVGTIFLALSGLFFAYSIIMIASVLLESADSGEGKNGQRI